MLRSATGPALTSLRLRPLLCAPAAPASCESQTLTLPLAAWLRRSATSSVPSLPASETLRFDRQHPNQSEGKQSVSNHGPGHRIHRFTKTWVGLDGGGRIASSAR